AKGKVEGVQELKNNIYACLEQLLTNYLASMISCKDSGLLESSLLRLNDFYKFVLREKSTEKIEGFLKTKICECSRQLLTNYSTILESNNILILRQETWAPFIPVACQLELFDEIYRLIYTNLTRVQELSKNTSHIYAGFNAEATTLLRLCQD